MKVSTNMLGKWLELKMILCQKQNKPGGLHDKLKSGLHYGGILLFMINFRYKAGNNCRMQQKGILHNTEDCHLDILMKLLKSKSRGFFNMVSEEP